MYNINNLADWFKSNWKNERSQNELYHVSVSDQRIIRVTEMAVQIECASKFGKTSYWFPKSVFVSKQEIEKQSAWKEKYVALVKQAEGLGFKVRKNSKAETIRRMINSKKQN